MFTHESFVGPKGSDIMKNLIRLEEIALFLFSIFLFSLLDLRWWWFPALLLVPDLSMAGYTMNTKIGAIVYNVIHHRAVALLLYTIGALTAIQILQLAGIIHFAHSSLDRTFDYGLKYADNFKHTHLSDGGAHTA